MDNAKKPPIASDELRVLAGKMLRGMTVTIFHRLMQPDVAKAPSKYRSTTYTVDVPIPKTIEDAAIDEYVWLTPEDRPGDAEPFPEDGRNGCDQYEYSYVDISGDPDPEEPTKSRRTRPSVRGSSDRSSISGSRSEEKERVRAASREVAEDCTRWPEVLCTGNVALDAVNLEALIHYYQTTFGHLGGGTDLKKHIAGMLLTLNSDMEAVQSRSDLPNGKAWVRARHLVIAELDGYRSASLGFSQTFVRETKLAFQGDTIPMWQRDAHAQAISRMKLQTSGVDVRTLGKEKPPRDQQRRDPPKSEKTPAQTGAPTGGNPNGGAQTPSGRRRPAVRPPPSQQDREAQSRRDKARARGEDPEDF